MDDIRALCPDLAEERIAITDFGDYPEERFYDDMFRLTRYRTDADLCERLVTESRGTMRPCPAMRGGPMLKFSRIDWPSGGA